MATTPLTSGLKSIGAGMLDGTKGRIVLMGDSVTQGLAQTPYQAFNRGQGIRGFGQGQRWTSAGSLSGVFTGDATVSDFADPLDFGAWMAQVDFEGGTSNSSNTDTNNRMLYLGNVGPSSGATDAAFSYVGGQAFAMGSNWWAATVAAEHDITIRVPIYRHPDGPQNTDMFITIKDGSSVIATSSYFHGYAATAGWEYVDVTVPYSVGASYAWLQMEVRFRNSTAAENGKTAYFSARCAVVDLEVEDGQEIYNFSQGGATVDDYNSTGTWSDVAMGVLSLIEPDVISVCLGLNDASSGSAETFSTELQALATRLRSVCPNAAIVFTSPHARLSYGAGYGGEGDEPYYTPGAYAAHQATSNSAFINMARLLPTAGVLSGVYAEAHSDIANGTYLWKGDVVESSGNVYVVKQGHFKTSTAPASDDTNFEATEFASIGTQRPNEMRSTWRNLVLGDGLHPTIPGSVVWMQSYVNGLQLLQETGKVAALTQTAANVASGTGAKRQSGTYGGTITAGMPLYIDTNDANKLKAARANASGTSSVAGIALNGGANGQPGDYQTSGQINLGATLTVGETYCLSDAVAGQIVPIGDLGSTDYVTILGVAISSSLLELKINSSGVAKA